MYLSIHCFLSITTSTDTTMYLYWTTMYLYWTTMYLYWTTMYLYWTTMYLYWTTMYLYWTTLYLYWTTMYLYWTQYSLQPAESLSLWIYWQYSTMPVTACHTVWRTAVHSAQCTVHSAGSREVLEHVCCGEGQYISAERTVAIRSKITNKCSRVL
jgi:hypothetical protein